jgi:hypothetical protein
MKINNLLFILLSTSSLYAQFDRILTDPVGSNPFFVGSEGKTRISYGMNELERDIRGCKQNATYT